MEKWVRLEIDSHRSWGHGDPTRCWCVLCESDVTALSLTCLPPRYCTDHSYVLSEHELARAVRTAVSRSISKVGCRPKHQRGRPVLDRARVLMVNLPFEEALRALVEVFTDRQACHCSQCAADILAVALNRFPPLYGVTWDGVSPYPSHRREFMRHDLRGLLDEAAALVASRPHH